MRFALAHQNPLVAARITGGPSGPLPDDRFSLVAVSSPDVLVWAVKPAEEGIDDGVIVRVWNLAEEPRAFTLTMPAYELASANRTTHVETDLAVATVADGVLSDTLQRQQLATYRLSEGELQPPGEDGGPDGGTDAGPDASPDAGPDDGGLDGGADGGADGGPDDGASDGCGCAAGAGPSRGVAVTALLLGVAIAVLRRRRGRAR
jgi:MYXO-CTERM domain-containing protein